LAAVGATGGRLILQAAWLATRWPACCLPARPRAPYGPYGRERACSGGRAGLLGAAGQLVGRETDPELKLGAILNTIQSSLSPPPYLHITHTYRHIHPPQGCVMDPPMWPWCCGLTARPVSGVEWRTNQQRQSTEGTGTLSCNFTPYIHLTILISGIQGIFGP